MLVEHLSRDLICGVSEAFIVIMTRVSQGVRSWNFFCKCDYSSCLRHSYIYIHMIIYIYIGHDGLWVVALSSILLMSYDEPQNLLVLFARLLCRTALYYSSTLRSARVASKALGMVPKQIQRVEQDNPAVATWLSRVSSLKFTDGWDWKLGIIGHSRPQKASCPRKTDYPTCRSM